MPNGATADNEHAADPTSAEQVTRIGFSSGSRLSDATSVTSFDRVDGTLPEVGDRVEVFDVAEALETTAVVRHLDSEDRLIILSVDWDGLMPTAGEAHS